VLAAALCLVGGACARAPRTDAWAVGAAAAHRRADRLLAAGDPAGARAALRALVDDASPEGRAFEAHRLALQDTYFRLARLSLDANDPRQALADADAGLAYGAAPHVFVANLFVARGAAREATGDPRGAAEDYHRALIMNEELLERTLRK
jgi:hypothetical protein